MDLLSVSVGIGLGVNLLLSELFGMAGEGLVVPGYLALHLTEPLTMVVTLAAGFAAFAVVRALGSILIVFGRRRTVLMILVGYLIGMVARYFMAGYTPVDGVEHRVVGYIIPGLIAVWLDRRGVVRVLLLPHYGFRRRPPHTYPDNRCESLRMKKVYWRPQKTPVFAFVLIAMLSLSGLFSVEYFRIERRTPYYREKVEASRLALLAMETIRSERIKRGFTIDEQNDPTGSGLIGAFTSPVTSDRGNLQSKQTSINPNCAAVVVELLKRAKVRQGDPVAVSFSGSFPALNISVLAALKVLDCKPTIITSASASQWGANNPDFLWIDMEHLLYNEGLSPFRTAVASMGGRNDQGEEMTPEGRELITETLKRNDVPLLLSRDIKSDIDERMAIYFKKAPPKAYINVGGGIVSAGVRAFKLSVRPGLLRKDAIANTSSDSVIRRFLQEDIPVVHLGNIRQLAKQYGLPIAPTTMPRIGVGSPYYHKTYSLWLTGAFLVAIILALYVFSRSDWGFRLLQTTAHREEAGPPEPMV